MIDTNWMFFWLIKGLWRASYINKHYISSWKQSIEHINWTLPWNSIFFLCYIGAFFLLLHWGYFSTVALGPFSTVTLGPFFTVTLGTFFDCYIGVFNRLLHWDLLSTVTLWPFFDCYIGAFFRLETFTILYKHCPKMLSLTALERFSFIYILL